MRTKFSPNKLLVILTIVIFSSCNSENKQDTMKEKQISVSGIAQNGKGGALIITGNGETYYISGLDYWEDTIIGKEVEVKGFIQSENFKEEDLKDKDGAWTQGMVGEKLSILKPEWKVIE